MKTVNKIRLVFVLIILSGLVNAVSAQGFTEVKSKGGGFDVESGTATGESITIEGKTFEMFATKKGSKYIKLLSARTGNNYPVWIGTETEEMHEGKKVYRSKKGSFCVYKISKKSGNPYPVWLKKN